MVDHRAVAELVRLPSVLTVPGDGLLGAAAAGVPLSVPGVVGRAAASGCLYLGGMALNDYADRDVDAAERPHRPIPSGRIHPTIALRVAQGLTMTGIALAGATGGWRALRVALPLAGMVWAYDLKLKDTPAGPVAMAACRGLDVLLGASGPGGRLRPALVPAAAVAGHTLSITLVSRHEAQGGTPQVARRSLWGTAAVTTTAAVSNLAALRSRSGPPDGSPGAGGRLAGALRSPARNPSHGSGLGARRPRLGLRRRGWGAAAGSGSPPARLRHAEPAWAGGSRSAASRTGRSRFRSSGRGAGRTKGDRLAAAVVSAGLLGVYASAMGRAARQAVEDPSPARLQNVVGTGVLGFMPLEGALLAGRRRTLTGVAVAALWPVARSLARRRAVT